MIVALTSLVLAIGNPAPFEFKRETGAVLPHRVELVIMGVNPTGSVQYVDAGRIEEGDDSDGPYRTTIEWLVYPRDGTTPYETVARYVTYRCKERWLTVDTVVSVERETGQQDIKQSLEDLPEKYEWLDEMDRRSFDYVCSARI